MPTCGIVSIPIMSEQEPGNEKPKKAKRVCKRLCAAAIILIAGVLVCTLSLKSGLCQFQSAEERLASIDAERAIPDDENAAIIYNQLTTPPAWYLGTFFYTRQADILGLKGPAVRENWLKLAEWLEAHEGQLLKLLEASKKEKCWFPITKSPADFIYRKHRLERMRLWTRLLLRAANHDVAEGQSEAALDKYRCALQMATHLRQQVVTFEYLASLQDQAITLDAMAISAVEGNLTDGHLNMMESALLPTIDNVGQDLSTVLEVERLVQKKHAGLLSRLRSWRQRRHKQRKLLGRLHWSHLRVLTSHRGDLILIALKRHKNRTGCWPESLDEVRSELAKETLIAPYDRACFLYKLAGDSFKLYSRGKNNVDEGGKFGDGADDWSIWPPLYR